MSDTNLRDLQRAAVSFSGGDFATALSISDSVLSRAPRDPEALHLRALALGRLGRVDEAVVAYGIAADLHPNKGAVLTNLGNALIAAGRNEEAVAAYRRAIAHDPRFINAWCCLGPALDSLGDAAGAEEALREALRLDPRHAGTLNNLGVHFHRRQRYQEAAKQFEAALRIEPQYVSALMNHGIALEKIGRLEAAINDYRRVASIAPRHFEARLQLGRTLRSVGRFDEAIAAFRTAISLAPTHVEAHRDFARMMFELGRGGFLADLDQAIAGAGTAPLLLLRAELALLGGDVEGARAAASRLLQVESENAGALGVLAKIARHDGEIEKATSFMRSAYRAKQDDFDVRHAYAEALLTAGSYGEAAELLDCQPPASHLQRHIALRALAWRALGDPAYKAYYDYDRFAAKLFIEPPAGYASLAEFNAALEAAIRPLHATASRPLDQTLYGGTQSFGRLWNEPNAVIQALKDACMKAARRYVRSLPDDLSHPFLARKSEDLVCAGSWSVILSSDGGHVDHFHPAGWISATYYVRVPPEVVSGERQGFLRLGGSGVAGLSLSPERWIKPEEGAVIFFPSYMWHGVEPFESSSPRVTAPFDLAPR